MSDKKCFCIDREKELEKQVAELEKDKQYLLSVMETMIPLTVCDNKLKAQWRKLIEKLGESE